MGTFQFAPLKSLKVLHPSQIGWKHGISTLLFALTICHSALLAYQCIITSASIQYPLESWLSYDVQFRTLAAGDPSLRWDIRHVDLWLPCVTQSSAQQSRRWPCPYCGATNHYPERCPFRPYSAQPAPNKQWNANRGQPNTRMSSGTTSTYSNSSPVTSNVLYCKDFNYSLCHRPQCRFVHHWVPSNA